MKQALILALTALYALCLGAPAQASEVRRVANGVVVTPDRGAMVRVLVYGAGRFRVTEFPGDSMDLPQSLMVTAQPAGDFSVEQAKGSVTLKTARGSAVIATATGRVSFRDAAGKPLLAEASAPAFTPTKAEGQSFWATALQFNRGTDEGFYGLGQHQNRQMNYNGEDVELAQHNMDIAVPFVLSTRNYGVLWDSNSITRFGNPAPYAVVGKALTVTSGGQPGWKADYYLGQALAISRQEATIDYAYIKDQANWPAQVKGKPDQRVVWTGDITGKPGVHKFRLYASSYMKVWVDGKLVIDAWRQNWNPWFRNFDVPMKAGKPVAIKIEWLPNEGYITLLQNDPLPAPDRHSLWLSSEVANAVDYYFVAGDNMDGVVAGYRALTGKAEMMPKWVYGFWQSRQRYETQEQLLSVVREYRKRQIPFDNIVQDWFYWPEDSWGCQCFDQKRYPDAQGMVDEVHALHAQIMISVWGKFYPTTDNAKELDAKGFLHRRPLESGQKDWVGPGYANTFYDPYSPEARDIYFRQMEKGLVSKGFDAWWMDADEPDWHSNLSIPERLYQMSPTAAGPGAAQYNSYGLVHADGVAAHLRVAQPERRPVILSRSGTAGTQRASAAVWSGDVAARWSDLRDQISAGVNLSMSGIPNWTHDIGGFGLEERYTLQKPEAQAEWKELNLRWFQFGAFSPLFRSHGETPKREIFEIAANDPAMYDAMVGYDRLRYRLMPYIYTIAADTWHKDGTIMRGLVMDFAADRKTWNIDDEYMFGPAFLVAPVTVFKARSRDVYLPAGAGWYDFATGAFAKGGQVIKADAPRERMPLFVRAGAIVPTGPDVQYAGEQPDGPIVLHVFTGTNGQFSLYEDDGLSPGYKRGQFARIPVRWDEASGTLTIGAREGSYPGMPGERTISVRFYGPAGATAPDFTANPATSLVYEGKELTVRRPEGPPAAGSSPTFSAVSG